MESAPRVNPIAGHEPHFTKLFATPHGLDFRHAATMFGVPLDEVAVADVGPAVARALETGGTRVLRVRTDRAASQRRLREVSDAVTKKVKAALESQPTDR